jgi:exopolysaccharide transport family protein
MSGVQTTTSDVDVDLGRLFSSLLARWQRIVIVAVLMTGAALALAWIATPHYKGETRILIETRESIFTRPETNTEANGSILDEEGILSQVEVIASTDILKRVAQKLDLSKLPEFDEAADMSMVTRLLVIAGLVSDPTEIPPEERVLKAFREKLKVYRIEKSRVIVIEFSSEDPELAARIPNTLADEYIAVQRDAKQLSNFDATEWLGPEITDLTRQVKDAEARVARFRSDFDLLVGQNNAALATQQLSELSSELSRVRASRGNAEATAQSVRAALREGASLDSLPSVLSSGLIQRLRERQVQLRADIADLSTTLLGNHPRIRALNSQLTDLDGQIRDEVAKVLTSLETEAKTARLREQQLVADLNTLKAESSRVGDREVELRALERDATSQRELLESYLTRYREAASRRERNYLPVDARVFSRAIVPSEPYFPKILPIAGAAFVASLLIMAIITLLQELFSGRAMRPAPGMQVAPVEQVRMPTRVEPAMEPKVKAAPVVQAPSVAPAKTATTAAPAKPAAAPAATPVAAAAAARPQAANDAASGAAPARVSSLGEITVERAAERLIASGVSRAVFVSPEGDEAAASAVLVAREVSDAGLRVLLLDLTSTGAASRPMLESSSYAGITNLLASQATFTDVIHSDLYSDCHVIPLGTADPVRAMRAIDRLPIIMNSLTTAYDVVVVECGPADGTSIRRIVSEGSEVLVSAIEPADAAVVKTAEGLKAGGFARLTVVTPVGYQPPSSPVPGRSAA